MSDSRKQAALKGRARVLALTEAILDLAEERHCTEDEVLAALRATEQIVPLLWLESSHERRHGGGEQ